MKTHTSENTQKVLHELVLIRQAFVIAGVMVLLGVILVVSGYAWGLALPALVAGGLIFSGITGWCPMVFFLSLAPWNRTLSRATYGNSKSGDEEV